MSIVKEFSGKVVLITGASSGIGAGTAVHFAKLGASVVIIGRNLEKLQRTKQQCIQPDTPSPLLIQADMTNEKQVKEIIEKTIQHFGKIDVLVNNAGIFEINTLETVTLEQYDRIFNTNIKSVIQISQLALPYLKASKGNIVNVSGLMGVRASSIALAYSMSKAALNHFTYCTALELAQYHVRVNCVTPGFTETDILTKSGMNDENIKEFLEESKNKVLLGRNGTVEDVVNAISYLASEKASFVNGISLRIDSGTFHTCNI